MGNKDEMKSELIRKIEDMHKRIGELEKRDSERMKIEEALRETELLYRKTIDAMGDIIHVVDRKLRFILYNETFVQWSKKLGLSTDVIGRNLFEIFPFLSNRIKEEYNQVFNTGKILVTVETTKFGDRNIVTETKKIPIYENGSVIRIITCIRDITARKQALEALSKTEQEKAIILDNIAEHVAYCNTNLNILWANRSVAEEAGMTPEQLVGHYCYEIGYNRNVPCKGCPVAKALKTGQPQVGEVTTASGRIRLLRGYPVSGSDGKIEGIVQVSLDVTEFRKAEKALKESEEMYRALVTASPDAIVVTDLEGKCIYASQQALKLSGVQNAEELIGKNTFDFIDPKDQERAMINLRKTLENGFTKNQEYTLKRKDGTSYTGELNAAAIKDATGHHKAFIATIRDVTERKLAEDALRQSEIKYKTLTEHINVGLYRNTVGTKGRFIEANPAIVKMFGYESKDAFLSKNVSDLYQNPDDRKKFNEKMLKYGFVKNEELRLKKKDGTPFFGSVSAVAVKDEKGKIKYYDGIVEDITKRKRAEEKLQLSFENLKRTINNTLEAMAKILESKDPYTAGHQKRVAILISALAKEMKLPENEAEGLHVAALIHDIGKIYVPAEILSRPTKLTESEFALIKTHPGLGSDILRTIAFPYPIADIILQHHERLNGSGYPQGLKDEEICRDAKILAVADVVEAMSAHRPYRPARSLDVTLEEMSKNRGVLYDSKVVDVCERLFYEKGFRF